MGTRYVADRLSSRARLKSSQKRDAVEEAVLALAADLHEEAHALHIARERELQDMELEIERLVKLKAERIRQPAASNATLRGLMPGDERVSDTDASLDSRWNARPKPEPVTPSSASPGTKPVTPVTTTRAGPPATAFDRRETRAGGSDVVPHLTTGGSTDTRPSPSTDKGSRALVSTAAATPKQNTVS
jgi:hypothetical protein